MLVLDRSYWAQAYANDPGPGTLPLAHEVSSLTQPSDRVGVIGLDWSPSVLYYANRWGLMVVERNAAVSYDLMRKAGYRYVVVAEPNDGDLSPLEHWRWVGALGTAHIRDRGLGDEPARVVVRRDGRCGYRTFRSGAAARTPDCSAERRRGYRSGERGTLILVSDPAPTTRVKASEELAPLPARRAIYAAPALADAGMLTLTCSGQKSLTLDVRDAPSPTGS